MNIKEMKLSEDQKKQLGNLTLQHHCKHSYRCFECDLDEICKAQVVNNTTLLLCLEENPQECEYSLHYGDSFYCRCPVRIEIEKIL